MADDPPNMAATSSRRRAVRFGTKTLLFATALVAFACCWGVRYAALRAAIRHQEQMYARCIYEHTTAHKLSQLCSAIDERYRAAERVPQISHAAVASHKLQTLEKLRRVVKGKGQSMTLRGHHGAAAWLVVVDERIDAVQRRLAE